MADHKTGDKVRILAGHHYFPEGAIGTIKGPCAWRQNETWFEVEVEGIEFDQTLDVREMEPVDE